MLNVQSIVTYLRGFSNFEIDMLHMNAFTILLPSIQFNSIHFQRRICYLQSYTNINGIDIDIENRQSY